MVPEPLRASFPGGELPEIPGFVVEGVIGRGASGTVYRAREIALDRDVALKVLHPEVAKNKQTVRRLQREARTTARLGHPHIVSAIAIGEHRGMHWYAMALVDGPSLAQVLRQDGRLREREALRYFIPLCEALEHLWEHGVVHRDVKPANILIDHVAGAQLADLGLAFADDDPTLTNQGTTLGTPHYISPEQAVDPTRADVRSDIWSFGATLYHAVCGRPPFHGESTAEVLSAVLHARVQDPLRFEPTLSRGLALILRKCLTRDTTERYQTPRELLLDLERVRERRAPRVVKSALDPIEREPRPWVRPALATAGVLAALAVVLAAAIHLGRRDDAAPEDVSAAPARFTPLEALAARAEARPDDAGRILRELEDLRLRVPAALADQWEALRDRLRSRLRADVIAVSDRYASLADRLAQGGDFVAARSALEVDLPAELLRETGFTVPELEERFGFLHARREDLAGRVAGSQAQHVRVLERKLPEHVDRLIDEAERLRAGKRFRSALAVLDVDDTGLFDAAGYGGWRFEPALVDELLGQARVRLVVKRQEVDFAWREIDGELRAFVERRAERMRETLRYVDEPSFSAADELAASFENELFERDLEREEMPLAITSYALDRLREEQQELVAFEDELRADRFRAAFDLNRQLDASRWRRREYEEAQALWTELAEDLAAAAGDPTRPWRQDLARRTSARREEARLLRGLMRRASAGVLALDGQRREMRVLPGGIVEDGVIRAGLDPLADGFALITERGEAFALRLEGLPARDLLELAGIPEIDEDLTPEDRLAAAAFRFHEGELRRAEATLRSGELPTEGPGADLAGDLRDRIVAALFEQEDERKHRDLLVGGLLAKVTEDAMRVAPDHANMAIDTLLTEYADDPEVKLLRSSLLEKKERLDARPQSFAAAYGPDEIAEDPGGSVRMRYVFASADVGAWSLLNWAFDGAGWRAPGVVKDWDALERDAGARLLLRPPLDLGRDVEVRIVFRVVDDAAPAQLFLVSLLGFHATLAGPGLPTSEPRSRWHVGSGDLADHLDDVHRGKGEAVPRLLRPGADQELLIRVNAPRGSVRIELDGELLGERSFRGRTPSPRSLVLRSWDPIRVSSVELSGSR
jgi:tRNA A-37 threonylcarbamoyl transferase component Bud32